MRSTRFVLMLASAVSLLAGCAHAIGDPAVHGAAAARAHDANLEIHAEHNRSAREAHEAAVHWHEAAATVPAVPAPTP